MIKPTPNTLFKRTIERRNERDAFLRSVEQAVWLGLEPIHGLEITKITSTRVDQDGNFGKIAGDLYKSVQGSFVVDQERYDFEIGMFEDKKDFEILHWECSGFVGLAAIAPQKPTPWLVLGQAPEVRLDDMSEFGAWA